MKIAHPGRVKYIKVFVDDSDDDSDPDDTFKYVTKTEEKGSLTNRTEVLKSKAKDKVDQNSLVDIDIGAQCCNKRCFNKITNKSPQKLHTNNEDLSESSNILLDETHLNSSYNVKCGSQGTESCQDKLLTPQKYRKAHLRVNKRDGNLFDKNTTNKRMKCDNLISDQSAEHPLAFTRYFSDTSENRGAEINSYHLNPPKDNEELSKCNRMPFKDNVQYDPKSNPSIMGDAFISNANRLKSYKDALTLGIVTTTNNDDPLESSGKLLDQAYLNSSSNFKSSSLGSESCQDKLLTPQKYRNAHLNKTAGNLFHKNTTNNRMECDNLNLDQSVISLTEHPFSRYFSDTSENEGDGFNSKSNQQKSYKDVLTLGIVTTTNNDDPLESSNILLDETHLNSSSTVKCSSPGTESHQDKLLTPRKYRNAHKTLGNVLEETTNKPVECDLDQLAISLMEEIQNLEVNNQEYHISSYSSDTLEIGGEGINLDQLIPTNDSEELLTLAGVITDTQSNCHSKSFVETTLYDPKNNTLKLGDSNSNQLTSCEGVLTLEPRTTTNDDPFASLNILWEQNDFMNSSNLNCTARSESHQDKLLTPKKYRNAHLHSNKIVLNLPEKNKLVECGNLIPDHTAISLTEHPKTSQLNNEEDHIARCFSDTGKSDGINSNQLNPPKDNEELLTPGLVTTDPQAICNPTSFNDNTPFNLEDNPSKVDDKTVSNSNQLTSHKDILTSGIVTTTNNNDSLESSNIFLDKTYLNSPSNFNSSLLGGELHQDKILTLQKYRNPPLHLNKTVGNLFDKNTTNEQMECDNLILDQSAISHTEHPQTLQVNNQEDFISRYPSDTSQNNRIDLNQLNTPKDNEELLTPAVVTADIQSNCNPKLFKDNAAQNVKSSDSNITNQPQPHKNDENSLTPGTVATDTQSNCNLTSLKDNPKPHKNDENTLTPGIVTTDNQSNSKPTSPKCHDQMESNLHKRPQPNLNVLEIDEQVAPDDLHTSDTSSKENKMGTQQPLIKNMVDIDGIPVQMETCGNKVTSQENKQVTYNNKLVEIDEGLPRDEIIMPATSPNENTTDTQQPSIIDMVEIDGIPIQMETYENTFAGHTNNMLGTSASENNDGIQGTSQQLSNKNIDSEGVSIEETNLVKTSPHLSQNIQEIDGAPINTTRGELKGKRPRNMNDHSGETETPHKCAKIGQDISSDFNSKQSDSNKINEQSNSSYSKQDQYLSKEQGLLQADHLFNSQDGQNKSSMEISNNEGRNYLPLENQPNIISEQQHSSKEEYLVDTQRSETAEITASNHSGKAMDLHKKTFPIKIGPLKNIQMLLSNPENSITSPDKEHMEEDVANHTLDSTGVITQSDVVERRASFDKEEDTLSQQEDQDNASLKEHDVSNFAKDPGDVASVERSKGTDVHKKTFPIKIGPLKNIQMLLSNQDNSVSSPDKEHEVQMEQNVADHTLDSTGLITQSDVVEKRASFGKEEETLSQQEDQVTNTDNASLKEHEVSNFAKDSGDVAFVECSKGMDVNKKTFPIKIGPLKNIQMLLSNQENSAPSPDKEHEVQMEQDTIDQGRPRDEIIMPATSSNENSTDTQQPSIIDMVEIDGAPIKTTRDELKGKRPRNMHDHSAETETPRKFAKVGPGISSYFNKKQTDSNKINEQNNQSHSKQDQYLSKEQGLLQADDLCNSQDGQNNSPMEISNNEGRNYLPLENQPNLISEQQHSSQEEYLVDAQRSETAEIAASNHSGKAMDLHKKIFPIKIGPLKNIQMLLSNPENSVTSPDKEHAVQKEQDVAGHTLDSAGVITQSDDVDKRASFDKEEEMLFQQTNEITNTDNASLEEREILKYAKDPGGDVANVGDINKTNNESNPSHSKQDHCPSKESNPSHSTFDHCQSKDHGLLPTDDLRNCQESRKKIPMEMGDDEGQNYWQLENQPNQRAEQQHSSQEECLVDSHRLESLEITTNGHSSKEVDVHKKIFPNKIGPLKNIQILLSNPENFATSRDKEHDVQMEQDVAGHTLDSTGVITQSDYVDKRASFDKEEETLSQQENEVTNTDIASLKEREMSKYAKDPEEGVANVERIMKTNKGSNPSNSTQDHCPSKESNPSHSKHDHCSSKDQGLLQADDLRNSQECQKNSPMEISDNERQNYWPLENQPNQIPEKQNSSQEVSLVDTLRSECAEITTNNHSSKAVDVHKKTFPIKIGPLKNIQLLLSDPDNSVNSPDKEHDVQMEQDIAGHGLDSTGVITQSDNVDKTASFDKEEETVSQQEDQVTNTDNASLKEHEVLKYTKDAGGDLANMEHINKTNKGSNPSHSKQDHCPSKQSSPSHFKQDHCISKQSNPSHSKQDYCPSKQSNPSHSKQDHCISKQSNPSHSKKDHCPSKKSNPSHSKQVHCPSKDQELLQIDDLRNSQESQNIYPMEISDDEGQNYMPLENPPNQISEQQHSSQEKYLVDTQRLETPEIFPIIIGSLNNIQMLLSNPENSATSPDKGHEVQTEQDVAGHTLDSTGVITQSDYIDKRVSFDKEEDTVSQQEDQVTNADNTSLKDCEVSKYAKDPGGDVANLECTNKTNEESNPTHSEQDHCPSKEKDLLQADDLCNSQESQNDSPIEISDDEDQIYLPLENPPNQITEQQHSSQEKYLVESQRLESAEITTNNNSSKALDVHKTIFPINLGLLKNIQMLLTNPENSATSPDKELDVQREQDAASHALDSTRVISQSDDADKSDSFDKEEEILSQQEDQVTNTDNASLKEHEVSKYAKDPGGDAANVEQDYCTAKEQSLLQADDLHNSLQSENNYTIEISDDEDENYLRLENPPNQISEQQHSSQRLESAEITTNSHSTIALDVHKKIFPIKLGPLKNNQMLLSNPENATTSPDKEHEVPLEQGVAGYTLEATEVITQSDDVDKRASIDKEEETLFQQEDQISNKDNAPLEEREVSKKAKDPGGGVANVERIKRREESKKVEVKPASKDVNKVISEAIRLGLIPPITDIVKNPSGMVPDLRKESNSSAVPDDISPKVQKMSENSESISKEDASRLGYQLFEWAKAVITSNQSNNENNPPTCGHVSTSKKRKDINSKPSNQGKSNHRRTMQTHWDSYSRTSSKYSARRATPSRCRTIPMNERSKNKDLPALMSLQINQNIVQSLRGTVQENKSKGFQRKPSSSSSTSNSNKSSSAKHSSKSSSKRGKGGKKLKPQDKHL